MQNVDVEDVLVEPVSKLLSTIGESIAETQKALDKASVELQTYAENDPLLSKYNYQAPWYYMPEIDVELKLALSLRYRSLGRGIYRREIVAAPVNAAYTNRFGYNINGATVLKVKIVSVPPERERQ